MIRQFVSDPRSSIATKWNAFREGLFDPDRFFEDRVGKYGITYEFIFVLFIGAIGAAAMYFASQQLLQPFDTGALMGPDDVNGGEPIASDSTRQVRAYPVQLLVGMFVIWFYYTTTFHLGSWFYAGRGTYFATLKHTAWGFLPYLVGQIVFALGVVVTFWLLEVETDLPGRAERDVAYLYGQGLDEPIMIVASVLLMASIVWCGYVWTYALSKAQELERSETIKIVAIPVALHIGFLLYDLLGRTVL